MVLFKTCPSVSTPVMLGGGMTIENDGFAEISVAAGEAALRGPCTVEHAAGLLHPGPVHAVVKIRRGRLQRGSGPVLSGRHDPGDQLGGIDRRQLAAR